MTSDKIEIKGLSGAILDMDGTVLDSMPFWENVGIRYLLDRGIDIPDIPELALRLKTTTVPMAARIYQEEFGVADSVDEIVDEIHGMIAQGYREIAPLKPNAQRAIEQMREHGVKLCIATATDRALAEAAFGRLGVLDDFEFILTCQDLGTSKNEPYIFDRAAELLDVPKEGIAVFEDSLHAIQTASAAGYRTVGVYDRSSEPELGEIKSLCESFIDDWSQLRLV